ncbi:hypothetical protein [Novosphingobium resinovorum]|uniref:hypothetical protein n=1 Tax=Novosphingobium resinovorum TaxID=158500 RepID=UPI0012EA6B38|nr:hypothetical protein [Novosphingobium resinovorum]
MISPEIVAAAIGALLVWIFQLFDKLRDRGRRRQSTLVAVASEVQAICFLIRKQGYLEAFHAQANAIRAGHWDGMSYVIDIRGEYSKVFSSNATHLSDLRPAHVSKIVSFYTFCQSLIDSTRPDGPGANTEDRDEKAQHVIGVEAGLTTILMLGDEIVQFPKIRLPVLAQ